MISPGNEHALLALANSSLFKYLVTIQSAASAFEIGAIQRVPFPQPFDVVRTQLAQLGEKITGIYARTACLDETDIGFFWSDMWRKSESIAQVQKSVNEWLQNSKQQADALLRQLDAAVCEAYHVNAAAFPSNDYETMEEIFLIEEEKQVLARSLVSYLLGCALGRWDVRIASGAKQAKCHGVFESLPRLSPAGFQGLDGQEETYPLRIDQDGIIPDDPDHADDIVRRVREVLELIWKDWAEAIEKEACEILGVKELRDYFRKPGKGGFWDDHVSRYSKSRRKAPIYWLLQSAKKNYALWLYYHRLDKDLLFKALVNYVEPKIQRETNRLDELRRQKQAAGESGKAAKKLAKDIERQEDLISELRDFEDKLRRAGNLHLEPDLNDGVVLNIAPLHELVPWKEAKRYWEELLEGKYEWSTIGKQLRQKGVVAQG